jgi:hypothetical protein
LDLKLSANAKRFMPVLPTMPLRNYGAGEQIKGYLCCVAAWAVGDEF